MKLRARLAASLAVLLSACGPAETLRVCADPDNLPYSNRARQGFENRIVEIVARDMGMRVEYVWRPQLRGYVRKTLNADACDVWPGVGPSDRLATTKPYYASTYVFMTRADRNMDINSFEDPRLRRMRIGVQLVGDDGFNTPPAHALAESGIVGNLRGYAILPDQFGQRGGMVTDVSAGVLDVGIMWGPQAGYYARSASQPLRLTPVAASAATQHWPMSFPISMGVRKNDRALLHSLERALEHKRAAIAAVLDEYGVPRTSADAAAVNLGADDD